MKSFWTTNLFLLLRLFTYQQILWYRCHFTYSNCCVCLKVSLSLPPLLSPSKWRFSNPIAERIIYFRFDGGLSWQYPAEICSPPITVIFNRRMVNGKRISEKRIFFQFHDGVIEKRRARERKWRNKNWKLNIKKI